MQCDLGVRQAVAPTVAVQWRLRIGFGKRACFRNPGPRKDRLVVTLPVCGGDSMLNEFPSFHGLINGGTGIKLGESSSDTMTVSEWHIHSLGYIQL